MIQVDPSDRNSAQQYLEEWRGIIFPEVYYSYIHAYFVRCLRPLADSVCAPGSRRLSNDSDSEAIIDMIWTDYRQLLDWISPGAANQGFSLPVKMIKILSMDIERDISDCKTNLSQSLANIYLLLTNLICSTMRNLQFPSTKLKALDLLILFGQKIDDEYILDRLVPYIIAMIEDENAMVRSIALKTLTSLVRTTSNFFSWLLLKRFQFRIETSFWSLYFRV